MLLQALHVAVLSGFAFAQPIYAILVDEGAFYLGQQLQPLESGLTLLLFSVLLPLGLAAITCLFASWRPAAGRIFYYGAAWLFATAFFLPLLKGWDLPGPLNPFYFFLQTALAGTLGLAFAISLAKLAPMRLFLTCLSPGLLVFPLMFLLGYSGFKPRQIEAPAFSSQTPVVLVVFDELSLVSLLDADGRIDADHFPNFAKLARNTTWYRQATTVHSDTSGALPAILTGHPPATRQEGNKTLCQNPLPAAENFPNTLFTLLSKSYQLHVVESYAYLCLAQVCHPQEAGGLKEYPGILKRMLRNYISHILYKPEHFNPVFRNVKQAAVQRQEAAHKHDIALLNRFLESIRQEAPGKNRFFFFHPLMPHAPWEFYPSGNRYPVEAIWEDELIGCGKQSHSSICENPNLHFTHYQRHLLQSGYADRMLGDILQTLHEADLYEDALIIITADHGIAFEATGDNRAVTEQTYAQVMPVPMLVKYPQQQAGRVDDTPVTHLNLAPTVVDVLGIPVRANLPFPSLRHLESTSPATLQVCSHDELKEIPLAKIPAGIQEALNRKASLFARSWHGLGIHGALVGSIVSADLKPTGTFRVEFASQPPAAGQRVNPQDDLQPLKIEGKIEGADPARLNALHVGIVLHDRIVAVTPVIYSDIKQAGLFLALLPESALNSDNKPEIVLIEGPPDQPVFHATQTR